MDKEIYLCIESFLMFLDVSPSGQAINFDRYTTIGSNSFNLMLKYELIIMRGDNIATSVMDITQIGKYALNYGIEKFLTDKTTHEAEIKLLELDKLKYDVKNAKRIFKTYWWTFGIAIGGFILAIFSIWLSLSKPIPQLPVNRQLPVKHANATG